MVAIASEPKSYPNVKGMAGQLTIIVWLMSRYCVNTNMEIMQLHIGVTMNNLFHHVSRAGNLELLSRPKMGILTVVRNLHGRAPKNLVFVVGVSVLAWEDRTHCSANPRYTMTVFYMVGQETNGGALAIIGEQPTRFAIPKSQIVG